MNTLRVQAVAAKCGVGKSTVWQWSKTDPTFPRPFQLSPGVTVWNEEKIDAWLHSKEVAIEGK